MKKLIKHELNLDLTWSFVQENLDNANALSIECLKHFKRQEGHFYTLLPEDANLEYLYRFKYGCILPQNPIKYGPVADLGNYYYSETSSIRINLSQIIGDVLQRDGKISFIIDDVLSSTTDKGIQESSEDFKSCIAYLGEEVYYLLNKENGEVPLIFKCLCRNCGYWHALSILSKIALKDYVGKELEKPILNQICENAQVIIIGAYDGEGYVFWEKKNSAVLIGN